MCRVLFLFNFESALISYLRSAQARDALVNGYSMQPGGDFGVTAESTQVAKSGEESFLSGIARILLAPEHAKGEREDSSLPALHDLAESVRVAR